METCEHICQLVELETCTSLETQTLPETPTIKDPKVEKIASEIISQIKDVTSYPAFVAVIAWIVYEFNQYKFNGFNELGFPIFESQRDLSNSELLAYAAAYILLGQGLKMFIEWLEKTYLNEEIDRLVREGRTDIADTLIRKSELNRILEETYDPK